MAPDDPVTKAVVLARGLGTRMRAADPHAPGGAMPAADAGVKAMIAVGRPFLDYLLGALADAGFREICLVIGPEHDIIRDHVRALDPRRVAVSFAVQEQAVGTADALLAARAFAGDTSVLVVNADNYYPVEVLTAMRTLGEPGLPAFGRAALLRDSNLTPERIRAFAWLDIDRDGYLARIVEKPGDALPAPDAGDVSVSMNCWRFEAGIFRACRDVPKSARGEFELPEAVQYGIGSLGLRFRAVPFHVGVLDLSSRGDIAEVARRLAGVRVDL